MGPVPNEREEFNLKASISIEATDNEDNHGGYNSFRRVMHVSNNSENKTNVTDRNQERELAKKIHQSL